MMIEINTNLFSGDLLFTTVFALHWKFLADLIMCLKQIPETRGHQIHRIYSLRKS